MLKKLVIATAVLATSSVAFANVGPYVGASIGVDHSLPQMRVQQGSFTTSSDFGDIGPVATLFGGYGIMANKDIYLGGEVFANANNTKVNIDNTDTGDFSNSATFKTKYSYGISFIPGLMLSNGTMAYARLGLVNSRFEFQTNSSDEGSFSDKKTEMGYQFGLGMQTALTQNLAVRGEYVYTNYNDITEGPVRVSPRSGIANVGLVYSFC